MLDKGQDRRRTTVVRDTVRMLPWKLDGVDTHVQMAFSEDQWSWRRIPVPKRNAAGYPIVNEYVVDGKTATEHAWVVVEGEITDRESRSLEEIAKAGRPMY